MLSSNSIKSHAAIIIVDPRLSNLDYAKCLQIFVHYPKTIIIYRHMLFIYPTVVHLNKFSGSCT